METLKVGFIGVGKMGSAVVRAVAQKIHGSQIYLNNLDVATIEELAQEIDATIVSQEEVPEKIIQGCDIVVLGLVPNVLSKVLNDYWSAMDADKETLWVSMAAGVELSTLEALTPATHQWVRIMPNTPVEINEGFISYAPGSRTTPESLDRVVRLLEKGGRLVQVPETLFDAATGLAGCGPAFIYQIIEAMSDAGVAAGLSREVATQAAAQTVQGAGRMVLETQKHPGQLKDDVTSPGGSTIAGVKELEAQGLRGAMIAGVEAAIQRSEELGK